MVDFKNFERTRSVGRRREGLRRRGAGRFADEARPPAEDIGRAHRAKVTDKPLQRGIRDRHPVDIDDRVDEPGVGEERRDRGGFDAGMDMRNRSARDRVGGSHGRPQLRQRIAARKGSDQQRAGAHRQAD